jgi:predicted porin
MNKKLVALAVSTVIAGAASAQTANVTLYGVIDTYLASERVSAVSATATTPAAASVSVTVLNAGGLSGSRWGLRGSESLGGGMNAIFTLENGFDSSTGGLNQGGRLFGRRAFVGLNGGFGQVQVGRDYSPNFWVMLNSDDSFGGGLTGFSAVANLGGFYANTLRQDNQVQYITPNMGGFTARAAWALGEVAGGTNRSRTFGAAAEYKNGPLYAGLGFSDLKNATGSASQKQFIVGAAYNFGVAYLGGTYIENKTEAGVKTKIPVVSVTVPFGASRIGAQFAQAKSGSNKANTFGLIAENDLSKRTTAYAFGGQAKNNGIANVFDGNTALNAAAVKGQKSSAFGVGMRHRF